MKFQPAKSHLDSNSFIDGQPSPFSDWTIARLIAQNNHTLVPKAIVQQLKIYQFETRTLSCIAGVPGFAEGSARPGETFPLLSLLEREFSELWASLNPELTGNIESKVCYQNERENTLLSCLGSREQHPAGRSRASSLHIPSYGT